MPLAQGSDETIEIEVNRRDLAALEERGVVLASGDGRKRLRAMKLSLSAAIDQVLPALQTITGRLHAGIHGPDEWTVEVGLQFGGETGIFFAKGTAEASIHLTMTWKRRDAPAS